MHTPTAALDALNALDGVMIGNSKMKVTKARARF
jgi:hypothetical protein